MQFANYSAFRVRVSQLIEGDDVQGNTFSPDVLDMLIGLGETRVYLGDEVTPGLRASSMESALSQAVSSNAAALPSGLLELKEAYFSGEKPLEIVTLEKLRSLEADGASSGTTRFAAHTGDSLRFWPTASGTVIGAYYARPADLKDGLHATFNRYPETFIFAALTEAALFLGMDNRLPAWEAKWRQSQDGANHAERMRVFGGSRLRIRAN